MASSRSAAAGAEGDQTLDLTTLPLQQLTQIKRQMEQELEVLTQSYSQLRMGLQKFLDSAATLNSLTNDNVGKPIFVPMTTSLYVPGELADVEKVVVDVGTGYYIEKTVPEAREFYARKEKFLNDSLATLAKTINGKRKNVQVLTDIMQAKMQDIQRQSQQNRERAPGTAVSS